jgi:hypothetical protein
MLARLDPLLDRAQQARDKYAGLLDYYPIVEEALGVDRDGRYLVLLQNSQEIRPAGGFPGTYAVITVREGRLAEYEFHRISDFDLAYVDARPQPLPAPAPIRTYLEQLEWLPHDTGWLIDFREVARLLLEMHEMSGEPPIQGVVAVGDRVVQAMLETVGPLTVTIEGEEVFVDGENVIDVIESYRPGGQERHKEAVKIIGTALLERVKQSGFDVQRELVRTVVDYADRREIQLYAVKPELQEEIVARGWDGALDPEPGTPTLGMTLANIVGNKASRKIQASSTLTIENQSAGVAHATWTIELEHTGDPTDNLAYNGFHRTWLALYLPAGSELTSSSLDPAPESMTEDPRAIGFHIELMPQEPVTLTVRFSTPVPEALLIRRQSGANDVAMDVQVELDSCAADVSFELWRDHRLDVAACSVVPVESSGGA